MKRYDVVIIGAGPAGYTAAEMAANEGFSVALVEERALGSVCLHEGCIPTKNLLHYARLHSAWEGVQATKKALVQTLQEGILRVQKRAGVAVYFARAEVQEKQAEGDFRVQVGGEELLAHRVLLCTGSTSSLPPIQGLPEALEQRFALRSSDFLNLDEAPEKVAIIGGGVIGLEFADALLSSGSVVHLFWKPFPNWVLKWKRKGEYCPLELQVDHVLLCTGRKPRRSGVRLEAFPSLPAGDRAWITDEKGETSVPGLYAAGDCCGGILLAHHASAQARRIVQSWLGEKVPALAATPSVLYTKPEVASVGLSLAEAQHIYPNAVERKWMLGNMGRYLVEYPEENGLLKLVYLPEEDRLLGTHLCGGRLENLLRQPPIS